MGRRAGISLIDLIFLANRAGAALPLEVQEFFELFVLTDHTWRHSGGSVFHHGVLQPLDDSLFEISTGFKIGIGTLSVPLVHTAIPCQLSFVRAAVPPLPGLEPAATAFRVDLQLDAFTLTVDGLEPAILVPDAGTTPRHLLRDPTRDKVHITGRAVLRFEQTSAVAPFLVRLIDAPDPLDPTIETGAVTTVTCSPPHFFIGGSEFGMSVGRLSFDFNQTYSPPDVLERGQGPGWVGVAIREGTFYAPRNLPAIGDLSGGVRNVLIGSPVGLQGELEVQFGRTPLDPTAFQFEQVMSGADVDLAVTGTGTSYAVTIQGAQGTDVTIRAGFVTPEPPSDGSLQDWKARWNWPDGAADEADASTGAVRHGQVLRVTPVEIVTIDGTPTEFAHPEVAFRFVAQGTGPSIAVTSGVETFSNVTHLGGTAAAIEALTLTAASAAGTTSRFEWQIEGQLARTEGASFTPDLGDLAGEQMVVLRETVDTTGDLPDIRYARLRLQIRDDGDLLVGCEAGVFSAGDASTPLELAAVEDTFDLSDFHSDGAFNAALEQATLTADALSVNVPPDALARVTVADGTGTVATDRHVQILMDFDTDNELRWGTHKPAGAPGSGAFSQADLLAWAARYAGAQFIVVGRCDDIGDAAYNATLAIDRATRAKVLLTELEPGRTGELVDADAVFIRGEQGEFTSSEADDVLEEDEEIALTPAEKSEASADASLEHGWLILEVEDRTGWPANRDAADAAEGVRETYRRVDIYAVGGTPSPESARRTDEPTTGLALRRSLVPASGRDTLPVTAASPKIDYKVKLRIVWDSPTVSELKDAIPTLAEAEFSWTPTDLPLPPVPGADPTDPDQPVTVSREVLTVFATWTHDARTGYTKVALGIRSDGDPDGLISTDNKTLTAALAFGPALLSGVTTNNLIDSGARVAVLLGATAFATVDLGGGSLIGDGSKTALTSAAFETEMRSISDPGPDMQVRVVADYVCTIHVNAGVLGLRTLPDNPMKIRYKRVGLEYDSSQTGWNRFGLVYTSSSLEIEDPGRWKIDGTLGDLLRIVEVTVGRGSVWIEARLAVALEIGLVEISEAIIRLTFHTGQLLPDFELRGLVVKVHVEDVIEGEGRIRIENDGTLRAGVDASIVPIGLAADAALSVGRPPEIAPSVFLSLYLGVQFATPLPLANSGLALYGFKGLFTMNGTRSLPDETDPIGRELAWWNIAPEEKYEPKKDQYAIGLGAVVGTLPDVSFCLSCAGMIVVAFPEPEVIFGVDINIIKVPDLIAKDTRGSTSTITGLIVIDDDAVKIAASASYTIPRLLTLNVPFAAYFPYPSTPDAHVYVRIGSDGQEQHDRYGEPVTLTVLPDILDARAWAYLMIEEGGLPSLGGDPEFSFDGFSVGFGAGWEINWRGGPIRLNASAKVLVGFGTAPLMIRGGVFVAGKLDMVVVSISARGSLVLEARDTAGGGTPDIAVKIEGEFCGEVDMLFFSLEGCVGISIDSSPDLIPPPPPSPVKGISLTDRRDRLMGVATRGEPADAPVFAADPAAGASVDGNNTVWPDTAPVIHFSHYVENVMPVYAQFAPGPAPTQPKWFGSSELKYAYRLDGILLERNSVIVRGEDEDEPLQAVWTSTPYRRPDATGVDNPLPSEHEGPNLKLLDWDPWAWVVNLDTGGEGLSGDPVDTIENLCDPKPVPARACVLGRAATRAGLFRVRMRQEEPAPPPYPSRFIVNGESVVRIGDLLVTGRGLQTLAVQLGCHILPGHVAALPFPVTVGDDDVTTGYRLPSARQALDGGLRDLSIGWEGSFDQRVARPVVTLVVCDAPAQAPEPKPCDSFENLKPSGSLLAEVSRPGFTMRAISAAVLLSLTDGVNQSAEPARPGTDGAGEVSFPNAGVDIVFRTTYGRVAVHVMQFAGVVVEGTAYAADGTVLDTARTTTAVNVPQVLVFRGDGISTVRLVGTAGPGVTFAAVVYRVCGERIEQTVERLCETFADLKPRPRPVSTLTHNNFAFTVVDRSTQITVIDTVDEAGKTPRAGTDGVAEIGFPRNGIRIKLPQPCPVVEAHVMLSNPEVVRGEAFDADGNRVATARSSSDQGVGQVLTFEGKADAPVVSFTLTGGAGEAVVYRICRVTRGPVRRPDDVDDLSGAGGAGDVIVTGMIDGELRDAWAARVADEPRSRQCRVVSFTPSDVSVGPWDGFRIASPPGKIVTLVSVCGVDQRSIDARNNDVAVQQQLLDGLAGAILAGPDERREIVLQPASEYEISVTWRWQAWQSDKPGDTPPADPPDVWSDPIVDTWRFATARDQTVADTPQDGLNEYLFDARDIARYLIGIEPADGRSWHFTDDPVWVHFDCGHVEQLLALYNRGLTIEVRRTDPAPQETPELLSTALQPIPVTTEWMDLAPQLAATGDQRLNAAVVTSPCLPKGGLPFGGASLSAHVELRANANYDLTVLASTGADRTVVQATRFHTSRYSGPRAFIDALGYTAATAPYLPDDVLIPDGMSLPVGAFVEGDISFDDALIAIEADTLPLPLKRARSYVLWSLAGGRGWRIEGLLVDSLEPMKREQTVVTASGLPTLGTRLELTHAVAAGTRLDLFRVNARWTRALLKPSAPFSLRRNRDAVLRLHFDSSDGALNGSRRLRGVPSILEREGL